MQCGALVVEAEEELVVLVRVRMSTKVFLR